MTPEQAARLLELLEGLTIATVIIMVCICFHTLMAVIGGGRG